jgi:hypothetical protein
MSILDIFNKPKDIVISTLVKPFLQSELQPYGTMTNLSIDSAAKSIDITLDLKGKPASIQLHLRNYQVVEECGKTFIRFSEVETSREWLNQLIRDYLPEERKTIPIPDKIASVANLVI